MNEFKIKNGLIVDQDGANITGSSTITGSLTVTGSITSTQGFTGSLFGTASWSNNSTTSSYALNGGVTQLLAGPNITLSPTNGLGQVTVSATLSGSTIFNTATGSYGSFYDTTTQTNPVANVPRSMSFDSTDITNGVSISGSTNPFNTYIKTQNAGVYNIQFSAQVEKTDSGTDEIVIWLRKNGTDLTDTATTLTLSGNSDKQVAAWNWFVTSAANDYYQIIWFSADTNMRLLAETISATHPGIPSVILTVNRIDQFLSNTGSFSGSFTGQFTGSLLGTASYANQALTASYASTYAPVFPFTGSAIISGSLEVTGSIRALVTGSDLVNIGNASTTNQRLVRIGQGSAWGDLGEHTAYSGYFSLYATQATPGTTNFLLAGNQFSTILNAPDAVNGSLSFQLANVELFKISKALPSAGAITNFLFTTSANTNQTATSNIPNFKITGANKQWATGTVPLQYFNYLTANTVSAVGASTFTNVYGLFVEAATAGTNATITNNFSIGTNGNVAVGGEFLWQGITTGFTGNNYALYKTSSTTILNSGSSLLLRTNNNSNNIIDISLGNITFTPSTLNGTSFTFTIPTGATGITASTERVGFQINGGSKAWLAGALTTQRNFYLTSQTVAFTSASTLTNYYGAYFEAATAGANATITNNYALGTNGNVIFDDSTSKMIWRAVPTIPSYSGIFLNVNPNSTNFTLANDGSGNTFLNGVSSVYIAANGTNVARFLATFQLYTPVAASSGAPIKWQLTVPADTNQTTTTNIPNFKITGNNKQWATGNITNQYWNYLTANTASFVGASTLGESVGLQIEAAAAGTNATITNNFALGLLAGTATVKIGNLNGSTTNAAVYMNQATPSGTNYTLRSDTAGNTFVNGSQIFLSVGGTSQLIMNNNSFAFQSLVAATTGAVTTYTFNSPNHSGQTASTEIVGQSFNTYTRSWLQGNITTQREMYLRKVNYAFSNISTITNAYRLYVENAADGGNATITNNYAAGFSGSVQILTGGLNVTGSVNASSFTGSLEGTASYAVTASYALNGGGGAAFPYTGSAEITGSLAITGSLSVSEGVGVILDTTAGVLHNPSSGLISLDWTNAQLYKSDGTTVAIDWETGAFTGSLEGTASYASTASYVNGSIIKSNALPPGIFGGTPLTATVTFTTDFPNPSYSITITGEDARIFTIQNKSATGFEINTNSNVALTGTTYWHAINYGEFNS